MDFATLESPIENHYLEILRDDGFNLFGLPGSLRGPNNESCGEEWAAHWYDALDQDVDLLLSNFGQKQLRVLDIGCGRGARAEQLVRLGWDSLQTLWHVVGLDFANRRKDINLHNVSLKADGLVGIGFRKADIFGHSPIRFRHSFDFINVRRLIHFYEFHKLGRFFQALSNLVRDDGYVAISFSSMSTGWPQNDLRIFEKGKKPSLISPSGSVHYHYFSEVYHQAKEAGFVITDAYSSDKDIGFIARYQKSVRPSLALA